MSGFAPAPARSDGRIEERIPRTVTVTPDGHRATQVFRVARHVGDLDGQHQVAYCLTSVAPARANAAELGEIWRDGLLSDIRPVADPTPESDVATVPYPVKIWPVSGQDLAQPSWRAPTTSLTCHGDGALPTPITAR
ncbi:MAG: hypothetical protein ACRDR6_15330 [Pseudonocardiaceae bacterium]